MSRNRPHTWHVDPGHAWLAVPRQEVALLGITVSASSRYDPQSEVVFLEQDVDARTFIRAYEKTVGSLVEPLVVHYDERSPIRDLPVFAPPRPPAALVN